MLVIMDSFYNIFYCLKVMHVDENRGAATIARGSTGYVYTLETLDLKEFTLGTISSLILPLDVEQNLDLEKPEAKLCSLDLEKF